MFYTFIGKKGNNIYHIGYDNIGKKFCEAVPFKPSIYYKQDNGEEVSLYGEKLKKKTFNDINEFGKFVHNNRDMIDFYGDVTPQAQFITENYKGKVNYDRKNIRVWWLDIEVNTNGEFPVPELAKYPIVAISIFDTRYDKYIVLGLNEYEYDSNRIKFNADVVYKKCEDEKDLMTKFVQLTQKFKPDIWIAHNGENFDYPYILNRLKNIGLDADNLSIFGKTYTNVKEITENHITKKKYTNKIDGISLLDNMNLYKKYISSPRESYSLSNLAIEDLGLDKLNYDEYDNLEGLYEKNYTKYIDYNINDVYLMFLLNQKNGYLDLHIRNTYVTKCENFEITMSPVAIWDTYIYHELAEKNIQIPPSKKDVQSFDYIGAFVVPTVNKKHKWVVSIDVNSMYPHTQMQWNISPEKLVTDLTVTQWLQTLTEKEIDEYINKSDNPKQIKFLNDLKEMNMMGIRIDPIRQDELDERMLDMVIPTHPDYIMTANGYYFKKDELGIIAKLLHENYAERKHIKSVLIKEVKEKLKSDPNNKKLQEELASLDVAQLGIKIMMNSEYGALANNYFRYCKYEMCSSITMNGQMMDRFLIKQFKEKYPLIEVIAGDTDSCVFDTIVYHNDNKIRIDELFNKMVKENKGEFVFKNDFTKQYVYKINTNEKTKTFKDNKVIDDKINYIMKHTVKKKMYKIKVGGKEVTVTQDHSLIVMRDNKLISVKPYQIKKTDKFIYINK